MNTKEIFKHIEWHDGEALCAKLAAMDGLSAARVLIAAILDFSDTEATQKLVELNEDLLHDGTAKKRVKEIIVKYVTSFGQVFEDDLFGTSCQYTDDFKWFKREHPDLEDIHVYVNELVKNKEIQAVDLVHQNFKRRLLIVNGTSVEIDA